MDFIIDNFDKLFDSEEHLKKLEEIILDLAVKGKLVPQNPDDEPASVLFDKIKAEKEKLIKEKKIKKDKELEPISEEEKPFEIPDSWEWVRLGEIGNINGGYAFKSTDYTNEGIRVIRISDFNQNGFINDKIVRHSFSEKLYPFVINSNDLLMAMTGGTVGKSFLVDYVSEIMCSNQRVATIKLNNDLKPKYIDLVIKASITQKIIQERKNSTNDNISMDDIKGFLIPLPPLAEQKRIVEKLDSLKKLIDTLKEKAKVRDKTREELKKSIMAEIEKSDSNIDLLNSLEMVFKNFDTIVKNKEDIKDIRDLILSMAVKGKLVPQNSDDEPASVLLEKIKAEKEKLIKEKKIKKDKELEPISEEEKPFEIPDSWKWVRLGEIGLFERGKSKHRPRNDEELFTDGKYPFVQTGDVSNSKFNGYKISTYSKTYNEFGLSQSKLWNKGTLCITIAANIAEVGFLEIDACFPDSVVGFISLSGEETSKYLKFFIELTQKSIEEFAPSTAQKNINLGIINELVFPLPPLAEQKRIVEKVDKLMTLCDDLEKKVEKSQKEFEKILESAIKEVTANNAN